MTKTEKAQFAELLLAVGALKGQLAAASAAPAATPAPVPAAAAPDTWIPRMDALNFRRPVIAVFDDRDAAFEFQKAEGVQPSLGHRYAVSQYFRTPKGYPACAVY